jgi:hypothetical protein
LYNEKCIAISVLFLLEQTTVNAQWTRTAPVVFTTTTTDRVGIGTNAAATTAESKLIVQANTGQTTMAQFRSVDNNAKRFVKIGNYNTATSTYYSSLSLGIGANANTPNIPYLTSDINTKLMIGTDGSPTMLIDGMSNGNVGIGTIAPAHKLDLVGSNGTNFISRVYNTNINGKGLLIQAGSAQGTTEILNISTATNNTTPTPVSVMVVRADNKVGIGTTFSTIPADFNSFRLFVKDGIRTEKVKVDVANGVWADFVFKPDYKLRPLSEVETFIKTNQHLPDVPSAKELETNGLDLAEMQKIQMQKIEELTLYLLELKKQNEELQKQLQEVKDKLNQKPNEEK